LYSEDNHGENNYFREFFRNVDEFIVYLQNLSKREKSNIIIVSDHGHGPNKGVFNLARAEIQNEYCYCYCARRFQ